MIKETMEFLSQYDPEVGATIEKEYHREQRNIELIASENIVSPAVMMAMGTCLTNKYAEGYPGKRYYGGCYCVDETEEIARQRACKLFGAEHANVQPHSGASANLAAFKAMLQPGDTFMGMNLAHGGHLSHGSPVNISGQYFHQVPYSLNDETEMIDYDEVYRIAQECKPKMILAGASAYPRKIDFAKFREIADSVGAFFMVDMAHIAGLVAAGVHESPVPYADVVTTTTHKTLRGPRGGMILCKNEITKKNIETGEMETINLAKKIDSAVFSKYYNDKAYFDAVQNGAVYKCEIDSIQTIAGDNEPYKVAFTSTLTIYGVSGQKLRFLIRTKGEIVRTTPQFPENVTGFFFNQFIQQIVRIEQEPEKK